MNSPVSKCIFAVSRNKDYHIDFILGQVIQRKVEMDGTVNNKSLHTKPTDFEIV